MGSSLASITSGESSEQAANKPNRSVLQSIAELNDDSIKPRMNFSDEGYEQARPLAERLGLTSSSAAPQMSVASVSGSVGGYTSYSSFSLQMSDGGMMPGEEATYHRPLPEIDVQQRYAGGVTQAAAMGWREAMNPGNSWGQRAVFGGLALAATPDAMVESVLYAPWNAAPAARDMGQYIARANMQTDPSARNLDYLRAISAGAEAIDSSLAWLGGARPQSTSSQSLESLAATRNTYLANSAASLDQATVDAILSTPKGSRPDPATYLSQDYINSHLAQFDGGVTKIAPAAPANNMNVGPPGGTFMMPKSLVDSLITRSNGNVADLERFLSLDSGYLGANPVRIDVASPNRLRMPSGNELGANKQWLPGGFTGGGIPEATINPAKPGTYVVNPIFH